MARAGLEAVEAAKADGRWQAAYDSPRIAAPPEDFLKALGKDKKAKVFFETLNRANDILKTQPTATEICVKKVNPLRITADGGHEKYEQTFLNFNDAMGAIRTATTPDNCRAHPARRLVRGVKWSDAQKRFKVVSFSSRLVR
jgi:hypothetical protein